MNAGCSRRSVAGAAILVAGLAVTPLPGAHAQQGFPAWVGLYDPAQLGWLENENRLHELCTDPAALAECHGAVLAPQLAVYPLYVEPDSAARRIGELIVAAVPGRGLSAHFRAIGSPRAVPFAPDLYLQDWGYGPYFHHTIAARSGSWFQLPRGPWPAPAWVFRPGEREHETVIVLRPGDILERDGSGWFVLATERDALVVRPEQPQDAWCEEGDPPPLVSAQSTRLIRRELLDADGHLALRLKYLKGC